MGMKRQDHTINSKRHVSPHVLSTDCCGESINAAATLPSCSVASRGKEHLKIIQEHQFHLKILGKKNQKWPILNIFLAMTVAWPPPKYPSWGVLGQLGDVIWGESLCKLTWQVELTSCHLSSEWLKRGWRRGWQVNFTSTTCQVDLSSSTCAQTQV